MKTALILIFGLIAAGCSTDEKIIAYCGEKHPHSQWGQMICQFHQEEDAARIETLIREAKRESEAKVCVAQDRVRMTEIIKKVQGYAQVAAPLEQFVDTLNKEMPSLKVGLVTLSEQLPEKYRKKVAAFAVKTKCDSEFSWEVHVLASWDNRPIAMRVFANSPPANYNNETRVEELGWQL
jgi:hypothetical protein